LGEKKKFTCLASHSGVTYNRGIAVLSSVGWITRSKTTGTFEKLLSFYFFSTTESEDLTFHKNEGPIIR